MFPDPFLPVSGGSDSFEALEELGEIGGVESQLVRYLRDGETVLLQHLPCLVHQLLFEEPAGRLTGSEFDRIAQVHRVDMQDGGDVFYMIHFFHFPGQDIRNMLVYFFQEPVGDLCLPG